MRRKNADLVQTTVRPVREDRPAFDLRRYDSPLGTDLSYHLEVQIRMLREALEVTWWRFKDKSNSKQVRSATIFSVYRDYGLGIIIERETAQSYKRRCTVNTTKILYTEASVE